MSFSAVDHVHMAQALRLAEQGRYTCKPNPMVGCVIADGERVLGAGGHQRAGEPHAEVLALRAAGVAARAATAYVTLEPCAHYGRTPPCADALIAAGLARVVYACGDPNPLVAGQGAARLRAAGIAVESGLMQVAARELNLGFLSRIERRRPYLRLKTASSLDGRIALASGESKWITGGAARADVQHWRAAASAILTGIGTVLADDPRLTARVEAELVAPLRVVLDPNGRIRAGLRVLDAEAPTLIVTTPSHAERLRASFPAQEVFACGDHAARLIDLSALLEELGRRGHNEVLVEAGGRLNGAFLRAGLIDEWLHYLHPCLLGDAGLPVFAEDNPIDMAARREWQIVDQRMIGADLRLRLRHVQAV